MATPGDRLETARAWQVVHGVVVEGYGVASGRSGSPYPRGTIEMQTPHFAERGLDLTPYYAATINVNIQPRTFFVTAPAHTFRNVRWSPEHEPEDFSFSACRVRVREHWVDGLVYYPHPETEIGHPHDPSTVEVLAPFIPGIEIGAVVDLALDGREISVS